MERYSRTFLVVSDPSIVVQHADEHDSYTKKKNIIIGTVVGGVGILSLIALLCYCYHRKRFRAGEWGGNTVCAGM